MQFFAFYFPEKIVVVAHVPKLRAQLCQWSYHKACACNPWSISLSVHLLCEEKTGSGLCKLGKMC